MSKNPRFTYLNNVYYSNNLYNTDGSDNLGYTLKESHQWHAVKQYGNKSTVYDVLYTTDKFRRRVLNQSPSYEAKPLSKHIMLFGCSYAFGEGLNDVDTLQYNLSNKSPEYYVYNYAVHGYGPQQMLARLESGELPNETDIKKGIAIYVFIDDHFNRLVDSTKTPWVYSFPYYYLDKNGSINRNGNFWTTNVFQTMVYSSYVKIYDRSNILKLANIHLPFFIDNDDVLLMYKLIEKSKELYEKQFDGKFYVLIHPLSESTKNVERLVRLLKDGNISTIQTPIVDSIKYRINGDAHPNALLNNELSDYIIKELKL